MTWQPADRRPRGREKEPEVPDDGSGAAYGRIGANHLAPTTPMLPDVPTSFEVLQTRERLRVGQRFLSLRPIIAAFGALGNALLLGMSDAPARQKLLLASAL